jgi:hypothetical protein
MYHSSNFLSARPTRNEIAMATFVHLENSTAVRDCWCAGQSHMAWGEMDLTNGSWSLPLGVDSPERGLDDLDDCIAALDNVLEECCDHELGAREDPDNALSYPPPGCDIYHWSNTQTTTAIFLDDWSTKITDDVVAMDQFVVGAASTQSVLGWDERTTKTLTTTTARTNEMTIMTTTTTTLACQRRTPDCTATLPYNVRDDEIVLVFQYRPSVELHAFRSRALHLDYITHFIGQPANPVQHHGFRIFQQLSYVSDGYGFRILQVMAYAAEVYQLGRDFIERLQQTREFLLLVTNIVALMPQRYSEVRDAFRQGCRAVFCDFHKGRLTKNGSTSTAIKFFRMLWIVLAKAAIDPLLKSITIAIDNELFLKNDAGDLRLVRSFYQEIINNGGADHVYCKIESMANARASRERETRIDVSSAHRAAIANNKRKEALYSGIDEFLTSLVSHYQAATSSRPVGGMPKPPSTSRKDRGALAASA